MEIGEIGEEGGGKVEYSMYIFLFFLLQKNEKCIFYVSGRPTFYIYIYKVICIYVHNSREKQKNKTALLSMKYWLFNRDPYKGL